MLIIYMYLINMLWKKTIGITLERFNTLQECCVVLFQELFMIRVEVCMHSLCTYGSMFNGRIERYTEVFDWFQNLFQSEHQGLCLGHLQHPQAFPGADEVSEAWHYGGQGSVAVLPPHHQVPAGRWESHMYTPTGGNQLPYITWVILAQCYFHPLQLWIILPCLELAQKWLWVLLETLKEKFTQLKIRPQTKGRKGQK